MFCFLRDVEPEDPTFQMDPFAIHHQHMNHVLSGSFGYSPFLSVTDGNMPATRPINSSMQAGAGSPFRMLGMSVGFMNMFEMMRDMIGNMEPMAAGGNCQTFSVSTVISYSNTGDGVPKAYQGTSEMCSAPSGIPENQRTVQYSGSGLSRLGQAHILQCSQNHRTGAKENSRTTSTWMKVRQQHLMMNGKGRHPDSDSTSSEISTA